MRRGAVWLLLPLLLASCAGGVPVSNEVVVPGGRFLAVRGEAALVVRSFRLDADGERQEVTGAECVVVTSLYEATLRTPARLVVPNFGPQSPRLNLSCEAGDLSGQAVRSVRTSLRGVRADPFPYPGPYNRGIFGRPWYDRGPVYPVSYYADVDVVLR